MIGKTNAYNGKSNGETVSISLKTNQTNHADLIGAVVSVEYKGFFIEHVYNGVFSLEIPKGVTYKVAFGDVNGYKTPTSVEYVAVNDFSRSIEAVYNTEALTVNVHGVSDGFEVNIETLTLYGSYGQYMAVEYIESTGNQFIDTGVIPKVGKTKVVLTDFAALASGFWSTFFGSDSGDGATDSFRLRFNGSRTDVICANWGNAAGEYYSNYIYRGYQLGQVFNTVEYGTNGLYINGTLAQSSEVTTPTDGVFPMYLFAGNDNGSLFRASSMRLSGCKIYEGDDLIRDYVAVKDENGVYGLYDKINDTFKSSETSEGFVGGNGLAGKQIYTQTTPTETYKIPYEVKYNIVAKEINGYNTPSTLSFLASHPLRSVDMVYSEAVEHVTVNVSAEGGASVDGQAVIVETGVPSEGVYIEDTSYKLWTADEWNNSATANSIVVSDGSMARRIALTIMRSVYIGAVNFPDEMEAISDSNLAIQDFNGRSNTNILKENAEEPSSNILGNIPFVFPDGVTNGYIPALGELYFLYQKKTEISSALAVCNGEEWGNTGDGLGDAFGYDFWSSTRCHNTVNGSKNELWLLDWNTGNIEHTVPKGNTAPRNARAISEYNVLHTIINGKASFSVPYDETYTVSLSDMDGYIAPESQTYTASQPTREISMQYKKAVEHVIVNVSSDDNTNMDGYKVYVRPNVANGVYIQDVNGNLYTESEWDTTKVANGIAVVTDECSFVIALEDVGSLPWSFSSATLSLTHTDIEEEAVLDYNGSGNTTNILNTSIGTNISARYCSNYIFPNGQTGYLGAAGEWFTVARFISEINELLSVVGVASIASTEYWTSTAYHTSVGAWTINPVSGALSYRKLSASYDTRAFAALGSSYTVTNGKVEFDVLSGVEYIISVEDVDGYTTPEPQSFVAGIGTREIDMVYKEVKLGVFIQGVSGKLYETNAWTSQETPNGVAVITEECSFVIALTSSSILTGSSAFIPIHSSRSGALENYMTAISTQAQAQADYDGATNTTNIMKLQSSTTYAAGWCNAFSFPSGKKGFMPSLGQMAAAYSNKAAVDAALTKAGGTAFHSTNYWTSTFYGIVNGSSRLCWRLNWSNGNMDNYYINSSYLVRAFSDL